MRAERGTARPHCVETGFERPEEEFQRRGNYFDLRAAADAMDAPFAKMFAVVREKAVLVFPKAGASPSNDLVRRKGANAGGLQ